MMKTVVWLASERVLPALGVVKTGERSQPMPVAIADQYIAQGEAREDLPEPAATAARPKKHTEES